MSVNKAALVEWERPGDEALITMWLSRFSLATSERGYTTLQRNSGSERTQWHTSFAGETAQIEKDS